MLHPCLAATLLAIGLALAGCGSEDTAPLEDAAPPLPSSDSADQVPTSGPPQVELPPAVVVDGPSTSCTDPVGDSSGELDLTGVTVEELDGGVRFAWSATGTAPTQAGWYAALASADGEEARQIGVRSLSGQVEAFVFDMGTAQQENLPISAATVNGAGATLLVSADSIAELGDGWTWRATVTGDGADLDDCPDDAG